MVVLPGKFVGHELHGYYTRRGRIRLIEYPCGFGGQRRGPFGKLRASSSRSCRQMLWSDCGRVDQDMILAGRAGRPIPKGALRSRAPAGPYYRAIAAALLMT